MKTRFMRILSLVVLVLSLVGVMLLSGGSEGILYYIDQPSLLVILIFTISMQLFSNTFVDYILGIRIAAGNPEYTTNELKASINAFDLAIALVFISCVIGFFIGTIIILATVDELKNIKVAYAVNLLVVFYAFIINLVQYSIRARLRKELIYRG